MKRREALTRLFSAFLVLSSTGLVYAGESTPGKVITSKNNFSQSDIFTNPLIYRTGKQVPNQIIGIGDSNLWGGPMHTPKPISCIDYFYNFATSDNQIAWSKPKNFANPGWTIDMVLKQISTEESKVWYKNQEPFDLWVNVGGNDFMAMFDSLSRAEQIKKFIENPRDINTGIKAVEILNNNLPEIFRSFRSNIESLYSTIIDLYQEPMQNLVIVFFPDLGKLKRLDTGVLENFKGQKEAVQFPITGSALEPAIRTILSQVSVYLNNQIIDALRTIARSREIRTNIIGINTYKYAQEITAPFKDDQHFTEELKWLLAKDAYSRRVLLAA